MLEFMTTLLPEYTRDESNFPLLSNCLGCAMGDLYVTASEFLNSYSLLFLLILFISEISVLDLNDHHYLSSLIASTCRMLELDNLVVAQRQLSQFLGYSRCMKLQAAAYGRMYDGGADTFHHGNRHKS